MRIITTFLALIAGLGLLSSAALADGPETLVGEYTCPGGVPLWLWVANEGAACDPAPSGYECSNQLADFASADCSRGCETVEIEHLAGCFHGDGTPSVGDPNYTVSCSNGRKFDLEGRDGDKCEQTDEGTQQNPNITGGKCYDADDPENIGVSADCESGCGPAQPGADCKER